MANRLMFLSGCLVALFFTPCVWADQTVLRQICFKEHCFHAQVMSTSDQRERGLMFRERLAEDQAMLFVFESTSRYDFWMKNMMFPIDILWINEQKKVVDIKANAPPCRTDPCPVYVPKAMSRYVLEIHSGIAQKTGIHVGNTLKF